MGRTRPGTCTSNLMRLGPESLSILDHVQERGSSQSIGFVGGTAAVVEDCFSIPRRPGRDVDADFPVGVELVEEAFLVRVVEISWINGWILVSELLRVDAIFLGTGLSFWTFEEGD